MYRMYFIVQVNVIEEKLLLLAWLGMRCHAFHIKKYWFTRQLPYPEVFFFNCSFAFSIIILVRWLRWVDCVQPPTTTLSWGFFPFGSYFLLFFIANLSAMTMMKRQLPPLPTSPPSTTTLSQGVFIGPFIIVVSISFFISNLFFYTSDYCNKYNYIDMPTASIIHLFSSTTTLSRGVFYRYLHFYRFISSLLPIFSFSILLWRPWCTNCVNRPSLSFANLHYRCPLSESEQFLLVRFFPFNSTATSTIAPSRIHIHYHNLPSHTPSCWRLLRTRRLVKWQKERRKRKALTMLIIMDSTMLRKSMTTMTPMTLTWTTSLTLTIRRGWKMLIGGYVRQWVLILTNFNSDSIWEYDSTNPGLPV